MNGNNFTITATCEKEGEDPLAHMPEAIVLFGTNVVNIMQNDKVAIGWSMSSDRTKVLDVLAALLGNHLEKPPLPDNTRRLINAAARPSACRACSSNNLTLLGNIFRCGSCGISNYPLCCTQCGGDLLIDGMRMKSCKDCNFTFAPPDADSAEQQP